MVPNKCWESLLYNVGAGSTQGQSRALRQTSSSYLHLVLSLCSVKSHKLLSCSVKGKRLKKVLLAPRKLMVTVCLWAKKAPVSYSTNCNSMKPIVLLKTCNRRAKKNYSERSTLHHLIEGLLEAVCGSYTRQPLLVLLLFPV